MTVLVYLFSYADSHWSTPRRQLVSLASKMLLQLLQLSVYTHNLLKAGIAKEEFVGRRKTHFIVGTVQQSTFLLHVASLKEVEPKVRHLDATLAASDRASDVDVWRGEHS